MNLRYFAASKIRTSDFSISLAIFRFDFSLALANCRRNFVKCRANAAKYRSKVRRYFEENKARNSSKFVLITFAQYCKRASAPLKEFSKGEKVYVKPRLTNRQQPWIFGEVIGKPAPRACLVSTPRGPVRRNHAQIREAKVEPPDSCDRFETASIPSEWNQNARHWQKLLRPTFNKRTQTSCKV